MESDDPLDRDKSRELITKHQRTACEAHYTDPRGHTDTKPQVQLKDKLSKGYEFRVIEPLPPHSRSRRHGNDGSHLD